jgi:hypothetical protein
MNGLPQDPERGIRATMMLAEYAAAPEGKLTVVGGGWTMSGPNAPCAIAMLIHVPWHMTNQQHTFKIELIDQDGNGVALPRHNPDEPFMAEGHFEVGRPPGAPVGTTFPFPVPLNLGPLGLPPFQTYEWRLMVDGETHDDWRLVFHTRPPIQQAEAA